VETDLKNGLYSPLSFYRIIYLKNCLDIILDEYRLKYLYANFYFLCYLRYNKIKTKTLRQKQ